MTEHDLKVLDTIDSPEYISGELSDDGRTNRSQTPERLIENVQIH
jgi:hypothetical protein